ncbi:nucleotidyltransferase domain-containing protein [Candidatus Nitrospira bockiana]
MAPSNQGFQRWIGPFLFCSYHCLLKDDLVRLSEDGSFYAARIASLAGILQGTPWHLVGGLAVPVTIGRFYRHHHDLDVALDLADLATVTSAMERAGYRLYTTTLVRHRGAGVALCWPITPKVAQRVSLIRGHFFLSRSAWMRADFMAKIDCFPYRDRGGFIETVNTGLRLPKNKRSPLSRPVSFGARTIPCFTLPHVRRIKLQSPSRRDQLDIAVIDRGLRVVKEWARSCGDATVAEAGEEPRRS